MLRIFLLGIANLSLAYTDFSSSSIIKVILLPLIDLAFAIYLFWQIGIYVTDNINSLFESMQNRMVDAQWQTPRHWVQYMIEFILWCVMFAQFMALFKKAILS